MAEAHILIVEDDAALLEGLRDILELAGFQVTVARNGIEGLAALDKITPDLIISDIMMPYMDGYQFYAQARARPALLNVPFIFLTAKGEKADVRQGKMLGADDYLIKPFDEEDLLVAIRAKLKRQAQLKTAHQREIADLKRSILTTLNHEFRTPLTYITTYSDILNETGPELSPEEFKDFMHGIQLGSERLLRLVEDFILLVELQTGEAQQAYERRREVIPDLPALLHKVLAEHTARATTRNVRLVAEIPGALPGILGDREFLSSAVSRLVDNGIKFSKREGGQVTLNAEAGAESVL
ncbi:MAG: hybrid sensor histidine kinase/response regulator, partial [Anaerolineales bacterium]